ncbi:VOC family protein [Halobellus rarus]|uniref:Fosmidomycin resistance protein n=1 Tax=Halobellus rarus TaxID=1126237 RepID=A0ABD6CLY3_9EURY|nr:VOC family protein [Halobellus rarus]
MLTELRRLGLEVKSLSRAREFYEGRLGLEAERPGPRATGADESTSAVGYEIGPDGGDAGPTELLLRRPTTVPRGGVHTHYAFSTTPAAYAAWRRRLADLDPVEFSFGASDSLYVYDPDGHCVEIGSVDRESDVDTADSTSGADGERPPALTGIFEVVLEVRDLDRAEARYRRLGFEVADRGEERRRVRLGGPVALELWEPQLGIADARGGLHVDLAFTTPNPDAAVESGAPWPSGPEPVGGGVRVVDDDGHVLTFLRP